MPIEGVPQPECMMLPSKLGGYVSRDLVAGGKLMIWPRSHRIAIEGRLAALLTDGEAEAGLVAPRFIARAAEIAACELRRLGLIEDGEPCYLRRLDLATDLRWQSRATGAAVLDALAQSWPAHGYQIEPIKKHHGAETTYLRRDDGKRGELLGRIYDRGTKTRSHQRGEIVRIECERHWQGTHSVPLEELDACGWRELQGSSWPDHALGWLEGFKVGESRRSRSTTRNG